MLLDNNYCNVSLWFFRRHVYEYTTSNVHGQQWRNEGGMGGRTPPGAAQRGALKQKIGVNIA